MLLSISRPALAQATIEETDSLSELPEATQKSEEESADVFAPPPEETSAQLHSRIIVLLRAPGDQHVMAQLKAELVASSWDVVELRPPRNEPRSLQEIARDLNARAVLRPGADRLSVDIWVYRSSGAASDAEETISVDTPDLAEQLLAFRVTEALRAHGLRFNPPSREKPPPEPSPEAPPPIAPEKPRYRSRGLLWLEGAPAFSLSPGGLPSELSAYASIGVNLHRRWSIGALGSVPLIGQAIEGREGNATIRTHLVGGALDAFVLDGDSRQLAVRVAFVTTISSMRGQAQSGFISRTDTVLTVAPMIGLAGHIGLSPRLQFVGRIAGGATLPELQVRFGEREAASWGQPFLLLTVGLKFSVF